MQGDNCNRTWQAGWGSSRLHLDLHPMHRPEDHSDLLPTMRALDVLVPLRPLHSHFFPTRPSMTRRSRRMRAHPNIQPTTKPPMKIAVPASITTTPRSSTRDGVVGPSRRTHPETPSHAPAPCGTDARIGSHGGRGTSRSFVSTLLIRPVVECTVLYPSMSTYEVIDLRLVAQCLQVHESPSPETPGLR